MPRAAAWLCLLAAICHPARAAPAVPAAQDQAARMTIPVMVDGHGPFAFVVDTGADRSVISRRLATLLALPAGADVQLHHTAGAAQVHTAVLDTLSFGGRDVRHVQAAVLEAGNIGADGMLGIDSLHGQRVLLDFRAKTFAARASQPWAELPDAIVVRGRSRFGQLVLVNAEADGQRVFVIVDSGAQNTLGNAALQRLLSSAAAARRPPTNDVISVMGGHTPARTNRIDAISLGGIALHGVPIAYADLETFRQFGLQDTPAMLLGMDVLRLFRSVSVDFLRREAAFVP